MDNNSSKNNNSHTAGTAAEGASAAFGTRKVLDHLKNKGSDSHITADPQKEAGSRVTADPQRQASSRVTADPQREASSRVTSDAQKGPGERGSSDQKGNGGPEMPSERVSVGREGQSERIEAKETGAERQTSSRMQVKDEKGHLLDSGGKKTQTFEQNISDHVKVRDGHKVIRGTANVKKGVETAADKAKSTEGGISSSEGKFRAFDKKTKAPSKASYVKEGEKGRKKTVRKDPGLKDRNVTYRVRRGKAEKVSGGPSGEGSSNTARTSRISTEKAGQTRKVSDRISTKKTLSKDKKLAALNKEKPKLLKKPPAFSAAKDAAGKAAGGAAAGAAGSTAAGGAAAGSGTSLSLVIPLLITAVLVLLALIIFVACIVIYAWYPKSAYITVYPEASVEYEDNYTLLDGGTSLMQEAMTQMYNRQMAYKYKRLQGDLGPYEGLPGTKGVKSEGKATGYYQGEKVGEIKAGEILEFEAPYTYAGRCGNKRDYYEFMLPASGWYGSATTYFFKDEKGSYSYDTVIDDEQDYTESYMLRKILAYATVDKFNHLDIRLENDEEAQQAFIDYCLDLMDDICKKAEYSVDYKIIEIKGDGLISWYGEDGNLYKADTAYIEPTVTAYYNVDDKLFLNFTDAVLGTFSDIKHVKWYIPELSDVLKFWTDTYLTVFGDIIAHKIFGVQVPDELTYYSGLMYAGPGTIGELNENAVTVYTVLHSLGFTNQGIAGILGNLDAESGIRPDNLENSHEAYLGYTDETYTSAVDSGSYKRERFLHDHIGGSDTMGAGYGIAQWTYYTRKAKLYDWAKRKHVSVANLLLQIDILVGELKSYGIYDDLRTCIDVRKASNIMVTKFERPAGFNTAAVQNARYEKCMEYFEHMDNPQAVVLTRLYAEERIDRRANEPQKVLLASMYYFEDMLQEDRAKSNYKVVPKAYNWCYTFRGFHTFEYCRRYIRECCCNQSMYWPMLDVFDRVTLGPIPHRVLVKNRAGVLNDYKYQLEPATFILGYNPVTHNGHVFVFMGRDEVREKEVIFDTGHGSGDWASGVGWADALAAAHAPGSPGAVFYTWEHNYKTCGSPFHYRIDKLQIVSPNAVPKYMRDYQGRRVPYTRTTYAANVQGYIKAALDMAKDDRYAYHQSFRAMQPYGGHIGVDCSSFVFYSLKKAGFKLDGYPFTTSTMPNILRGMGFRMIPIDSAGQLMPGDILWWDGAGNGGHTEIYIGNGQMVGAHGRHGKYEGNYSAQVSVCPYYRGSFTHVFRRSSMFQ